MQKAIATEGMRILITVWGKIPFKAVFLIALLLQFIGEQFPFSNFPMFASLGTRANYMFVANGNDQPIATDIVLSTGTDRIKKMYNARVRAVGKKSPTPEQEENAGREILESIVTRLPEKQREGVASRGLKLYWVDILRAGNRLETAPRLISEIPPSGRSNP